jgi:signal transduction histidine kinase
LLNIAGHELRSPITPLKMRLQQLRRRLQREGGRERDIDDLAKALYQIERLQQQIAIFLDAPALMNGSFTLALRLCDLNEAARRLTSIYANADTDRVIRLEEPGEPLTGMWDGTRLDCVLRELLGNALKYTTGDITVRLWRDGSLAHLEVEDAGPTIPVSFRERVFEPYVTGYQSNHGLGLGLYVAHEIIRLHDGEMGMRFNDSGGAIFWLTLPTEPPEN